MFHVFELRRKQINIVDIKETFKIGNRLIGALLYTRIVKFNNITIIIFRDLFANFGSTKSRIHKILSIILFRSKNATQIKFLFVIDFFFKGSSLFTYASLAESVK